MGLLSILVVIACLLAVVTLIVYTQKNVAPSHELEGWKRAYSVCTFLLACSLMAVLVTGFAKLRGDDLFPEAPFVNDIATQR